MAMLTKVSHGALEPAPFLTDVADGPDGGAAWWVKTADGTRIRLGVWPEGPRGTVLMFPGRTEYIEKYGRLARDFAAQGYGMVAVDWRGQGLADRPQHRRDMGHVVSFDEYREDVAAMRYAMRELELKQPGFLIGHSMGGAIGLRALHDGLPAAAAIFSAPMWGIRMSPFQKSIAGIVLGLSRPLGLDKSFAPTTGPAKPMVFDDNPLTTDRGMFDYMTRQLATHPELALGGPSIRWVDAALKESRLLREMAAPPIPALTVLGSRERIVESDAVRSRMSDWPGGELFEVEGAEHEVLMEAPAFRDRVLSRIFDWFDRHA